MRHLQHLRTTPWAPQFEWVDSLEKAADYINRPHEDYPQRVTDTAHAIQWYEDEQLAWYIPMTADLKQIHRLIFVFEHHRGRFRKVGVRIGDHIPPRPASVPSFMGVLTRNYDGIADIEILEDWYWDFNTIHPFEDGNGRVSGVVLATLSHALEPEKGWLAPLQ
jgi:fido (protein-threonine AMPylation protein)